MISVQGQGDYDQHKPTYLKTGDVDWHEILADLGPLDGAGTRSGDVEDLRPQAADRNAATRSSLC